MAFSSVANAGITIPAGEWTVDIGGNVNAYYTNTRFSGNAESNVQGAYTSESANRVQTGLLPSAVGIGGKTRQNDLDIAFQFTFFTGGDSNTNNAFGNNVINVRQAYMTFGDASWGTVKMGRDLGLFASDAILSDMTLLGVGVGAGLGGTTTLGRIGSGYQYADWKGQVSYQSPNWNGFDFAVGVTEAFRGNNRDASNNNLAFEGKAGYSWTGDVSGKVWTGFISQKHEDAASVDAVNSAAASAGTAHTHVVTAAQAAQDGYTTRGWDLGAKVNAGHLGLVAYGYKGKGLSGAGTTASNLSLNGGLAFGSSTKTDDEGGYVQATYVIPTGTKLGLSYGESRSEAAGSNLEFSNKSWMLGAYHPLTKSLNLVAEYIDNKLEQEAAGVNPELKAKTIALGAILFY